MNHWLFVWAAYAVALGGTAGVLIVSLVRMRAAEKRAASLRRDR